MGRYIFQPMSYREYLSKFINTLKTGELLVNLEDHDIYVTEEGINIPVPIISPLRNDIINYLENDLEGIKVRMSLNPSRIDNLFKIKSEIEKEEQDIYGKIRELNSIEDYVRNKYVFINKITEYNVNQLGDLVDNVKDYGNSLGNYKKEIDELMRIFNSINDDCSSYDKLYNNNNAELMEIWNFLSDIYKELNNKINKFNTLSGNIKIGNYSTRNIDIYDIHWNRRLNRFQEGIGDYNLSTYTSGLSYTNDRTQYVKNCLDVTSRYRCFMSRHSQLQPGNLSIEGFYMYRGSNILYPGFMNKKDLNKSNKGSIIGRHFYPFDCFELPAFTSSSYKNIGKEIYNKVISKYDAFEPGDTTNTFNGTGGIDVKKLIDYIRSASNNVLPYIYGDYSDANKNGFAVKCKASNTPSQNTAYNNSDWGKKLNIYKKEFSFDMKAYKGEYKDESMNLGFKANNINKFSPNQYLPKYMCGIKNSSTNHKTLLFNQGENEKDKSNKFNIDKIKYQIYSGVLPSVARCVTQSWAGHGGREYIASSCTHNSDAIIFRMGLVKTINETVMSSNINLKYDNSKGWVKG